MFLRVYPVDGLPRDHRVTSPAYQQQQQRLQQAAAGAGKIATAATAIRRNKKDGGCRFYHNALRT